MVKRKAPSRAAKKDPYDLQHLLTSDKSRLIDIDLHGKLAGFFSDAGNWAEVSDEDKEYIRSVLPPHVELNDDGSIPDDFWRYNSEFRLDCRNLQEDLRAGRMDPEWQRQAHQAMEERAAGDFDAFKEREFEEFWGQKQKVDSKFLAGDASKVRLDEMLTAGLFKEGDVWSFSHTFGRREDAVSIQKECRIVEIEGKTITLAIPPGQRKFAQRLDRPVASQDDRSETSPLSSIPSSIADGDEDTTMGGMSLMKEEATSELNATSLATRTKVIDGVDLLRQVTEKEVAEAPNEQDISAESITQTPLYKRGKVEPEAGTNPITPEANTSSPEKYSKKAESTAPLIKDADHAVSLAGDYDVILWKGTGLMALEKKIFEIDGRAKADWRTGSTWRDMRCRRNEQDMGSLFEMRDEYYAYKVAGK